MTAVGHRHPSGPNRARLLYSKVYRADTDTQTQPSVCINGGGGGRLRADDPLRRGINQPVPQRSQVETIQPRHPVRADAAQIRLDQRVGGIGGVLIRHAQRNERGDRKLPQHCLRDADCCGEGLS